MRQPGLVELGGACVDRGRLPVRLRTAARVPRRPVRSLGVRHRGRRSWPAWPCSTWRTSRAIDCALAGRIVLMLSTLLAGLVLQIVTAIRTARPPPLATARPDRRRSAAVRPADAHARNRCPASPSREPASAPSPDAWPVETTVMVLPTAVRRWRRVPGDASRAVGSRPQPEPGVRLQRAHRAARRHLLPRRRPRAGDGERRRRHQGEHPGSRDLHRAHRRARAARPGVDPTVHRPRVLPAPLRPRAHRRVLRGAVARSRPVGVGRCRTCSARLRTPSSPSRCRCGSRRCGDEMAAPAPSEEPTGWSAPSTSSRST